MAASPEDKAEPTRKPKPDAEPVSRRGFVQQALGLSVGTIASAALFSPEATASTAPQSSAAGQAAPLLQGRDTDRRISNSPRVRGPVEASVHINQVGFLPNEPKRGVVAASGPIIGNAFYIVDDDVTPQIRFRGELLPYTKPLPYTHHFSHHFHAEFDSFRRHGRYRLRLSDGQQSVPFSIGGDVYSRLLPLVLSYFDVQRCGNQRSALRGPCHTDDGILVGGPRNGQPFDASGGWHDAGDYLKFVETTSYVAAILLVAYDHYHPRFPNAMPNHRLPLLLQYAKVGLDWLLKMHPSPNEFYFQVGDETDHDSWRLPEEDDARANPNWKPRPVYFGVGANLAGRTATAFAIAARVYQPYMPEFARHCHKAAETVYALGLKNLSILTTKPADFYPETTWQDDMEWAATHLYELTQRQEYLTQALQFSREAGPAHDNTSVYNVHALAHHALFPHAPAKDQDRLLDHLRVDAEYARSHAENPYGLGTPYIWGTAEAAAGAALNCRLYAALTGEKQYLDIARWQRDYILGCNPFGLSCLIGAGTRYPLFPHHQIANIKNVELSGAIVGGPTSYAIFEQQKIGLDAVEFNTQNAGPPLAQDPPDQVGVYHDAVQDYVTNEPANDYTAKFLLLIAYYLAV